MSNRLNAIRNREIWALTPGEQARVAALATVAGIKLGRGKGAGAAGSGIDRVFQEAERRVLAEEAAAEREAEKRAQAKADAKAARKGWW
ncbi:hypothetical protein [Streptomyces sp. cg2]|uniref:hypothetical protein n=1 Tax=Streptomyces sp. cg2 TaxID=3238799 RepID=UPI0034E25108